MPSPADAFRFLTCGRPFVLGVNNQVVSYCGQPLCDPLLQSSVSAHEPFRYATGLFHWEPVATHVPGGPVPADNADSDDLAIETQQQLNLFQSGVGELMPGGWWIQTISDTDTFRQGAPVDRPYCFLVTGLTFNALDAFQRGGTGTSGSDPRLYSNWLQQSTNGPGYSFQMQRFHINYTAMQFIFGDTGSTYRVGIGGYWPVWGDPTGDQTVRNGLTSAPGMYLPFTTAVCVGPRDDARFLNLQLTTGQAGRVQNNPAQPTISGSREGTDQTINLANDGTTYVPVRVTLVGYIVCVPGSDQCGIPTLSPDEIAVIRSRYLGTPMVGGIPTPP